MVKVDMICLLTLYNYLQLTLLILLQQQVVIKQIERCIMEDITSWLICRYAWKIGNPQWASMVLSCACSQAMPGGAVAGGRLISCLCWILLVVCLSTQTTAQIWCFPNQLMPENVTSMYCLGTLTEDMAAMCRLSSVKSYLWKYGRKSGFSHIVTCMIIRS